MTPTLPTFRSAIGLESAQPIPKTSHDGDPKRDLLLRFRTITSMINTLQSQSAIPFTLKVKSDGGTGSIPRHVLDALALVLVREHEVTAVVSGHSLISTLDLLAASSPDTTDGQTLTPTQHEVIAIPNPNRPNRIRGDVQTRDKGDALQYQFPKYPDIVAPKDTTPFQEDPIAYALKDW
jgi:hypothetical protein